MLEILEKFMECVATNAVSQNDTQSILITFSLLRKEKELCERREKR